MPAVWTVLGPVEPESLGTTLMHEHLVPRPQVPRPPAKPPFAPRVGEADVARELAWARQTYGLATVVDCTPRRSAEELASLERIAREAGVSVVAATGCMKEQYYHPARGTLSSFWAYGLQSDEIAAVLVQEIEHGINGTRFRAGIIKVGTSKQRITRHEERVLRGAARRPRSSSRKAWTCGGWSSVTRT